MIKVQTSLHAAQNWRNISRGKSGANSHVVQKYEIRRNGCFDSFPTPLFNKGRAVLGGGGISVSVQNMDDLDDQQQQNSNTINQNHRTATSHHQVSSSLHTPENPNTNVSMDNKKEEKIFSSSQTTKITFTKVDRNKKQMKQFSRVILFRGKHCRRIRPF